MDFAYLHLITNHIPIIGIPIATFVFGFGTWRRAPQLQFMGLMLFVGLAAMTLGTFFLGDAGEDFVEKAQGVAHDSIHDHEGFARVALAFVLLNGMLSAAAIHRYFGIAAIRASATESTDDRIDGVPTKLAIVALGLAIVCAAVLGYTGKLGGKITHSEFYGTTATMGDNEPETELNTKEADQEGGRKRRHGGR